VFDELLKELKRLERATKVSVPISSDEKGYMDRQCPADNCEFLFKVHEEDWTNIFKDEAVWCPFCRHEAPSDQWFTKAQIKHAEAEALAMVEGRISKAMLADSKTATDNSPETVSSRCLWMSQGQQNERTLFQHVQPN
jgi:hypothetical protein